MEVTNANGVCSLAQSTDRPFRLVEQVRPVDQEKRIPVDPDVPGIREMVSEVVNDPSIAMS